MHEVTQAPNFNLHVCVDLPGRSKCENRIFAVWALFHPPELSSDCPPSQEQPPRKRKTDPWTPLQSRPRSTTHGPAARLHRPGARLTAPQHDSTDLEHIAVQHSIVALKHKNFLNFPKLYLTRRSSPLWGRRLHHCLMTCRFLDLLASIKWCNTNVITRCKALLSTIQWM